MVALDLRLGLVVAEQVRPRVERAELTAVELLLAVAILEALANDLDVRRL